MQMRTLAVRPPGWLARLFNSVHDMHRNFALIVTLSLISAVSVQARPGLAERESNPTGSTSVLSEALGIHFVEGSTSTIIVERNGKEYVIDLVARTIRDSDDPALADVTPAAAELQQRTPTISSTDANGAKVYQQQCSMCHGADGKGLRSTGTPDFTEAKVQSALSDQALLDTIRNGKPGTAMPAWSGKLSDAEIRAAASFVRSFASGNQGAVGAQASNVYEPQDDFVYSLPTGRKLTPHGLYVNFTHRYAYDPAFSGRARGDMLLGLDGFAIASFGLRYAVTDKFSVSAYRSPSAIGRPIEFTAGYQFLDEHAGHPANASFRVSINGQDDFSQNFTTSFEGIVSRSFSKRAQLYGVPTVSLQNRRVISKPGELEDPPPNLPGINSFSLGIGGALDIRPTIAVVAEVIPTLVHGRDLGIHRPAYGFGIQKRVRGHAFTLGFSNSPGTTVAQRAGTRAAFLNNPAADKPRGLVIGFNLMRQLH
jgi:mono/diheme cytochrome c family protein